jgi:16S rRNA processing protein RimM
LTRVTAGRVGKAHGRDGSFYVEDPRTDFSVGMQITIADRSFEVERRAGIDDRPIIRLGGVDDPAAIRNELILIEDELEAGEYLVEDLVGCEVPGLGYVERVLDAPSCPLLEVGEDQLLIPMIGDAVKSIDLEKRIIEVDREFLGY